MSGNLPKIANITVGNISSRLISAQSEKTDLEKEKTSVAKSGDENCYVDMETSELSNAIENIEEELSFIQKQMESIEEAINSNAKLKEKYEEEYMTIKSKIEDAKSKLETASTEEMQRFYQTRIFTLGQSLNLIGVQIDAVNGMIETKNETGQALQKSYKNAYTNYQNAANAYNIKNQNTGVLNSAPVSSYAAASGGINSVSELGVSNTDNSVASTYAAAAGTNVSDRMLNAMKNWEGCILTAYKCPAGVWTIGYGHTGNIKPGQKISQQQAENLLKQDLAKFENAVTSKANSMGLNLTQGQYDSLVSFAYNLGPGKLPGIMQLLKNGDIDEAANKMKQYCHAGGKKLSGLVSRRNTEASWLYT